MMATPGRATYIHSGAEVEFDSSVDDLKEVAMRIRWLIFAGAAILLIAPATAQTFDPSSPVCLQKWGWGGSRQIQCAYRSWDECRAAGAGLSAMCLENPYWPRVQPKSSGRRARSPVPY